MRPNRMILAVALLVSFSLCALPAKSLAAGIEGKWKIKVEPDEDARKAGQREYDDTLTFTATKFTSESAKQKGFGESDYTEDTRRFGPVVFTAEPSSEKEGKMKWTGTVVVNEISGEIVWTTKDGKTMKYTYKGSKAP